MKLQVGLLGDQPGFQIILNQEGIPNSHLSPEQEISREKFPVLIFEQLFSGLNKTKLVHYVQEGGSLLISAEAYSRIFQARVKQKKVKYLIPEKNSIFSEIGLIDIFNHIQYPISDNIKPVDENLYIFEQKLGKGKVLILPFAVSELIVDWRSQRKKFYAERAELPSEIVASVSKNKIRKLVHNSLAYLFYSQNLPFVTKWFYPQGYEKAFLFRVDTDFCSREDAEEFYKILLQHNINSTWFVDTDSNQKLQEFYAKIKPEIALHCKDHKVYENYEENFKNLEAGISRLENAGIRAAGFAAPFGQWHPSLAEVLADLDFKYSSEFTLAYDGFPFFPYYGNKFSDALQIPIHPVSLGRLRRSHFKGQEMRKYYLRVLKHKNTEHEPVIFYHHPHHKKFSVFSDLFENISESNFWNPTFLEYSNWWKSRDQIKLKPEYSEGKIIFDQPYGVHLRISTQLENYKIVQARAAIDVDKIGFRKRERNNYPHDIARTRNFSWRDILYNFETWRAKNK